MNTQKPDLALEIQNLSVEYRTGGSVVKALNSLDLSIKRGTALGLVGETGAGKTTTGLAVLRLVPNPPALLPGAPSACTARTCWRRRKSRCALSGARRSP